MLNENVIKLFDILGYVISIDNENRINLIDKNTNLPVMITKEEGKYFAKNDSDYITFAFNYPITIKNSEVNNYLNILTINKMNNDDVLRIGFSENQLLIGKHDTKKEGCDTKITSFSLLINIDGTLTINITNDPMAYAIWKRNEILTNVPDERILDIFDDERLLAIIQYYSTMYPEMIESVVELTQSIVSKTSEEPLTRKLDK